MRDDALQSRTFSGEAGLPTRPTPRGIAPETKTAIRFGKGATTHRITADRITAAITILGATTGISSGARLKLGVGAGIASLRPAQATSRTPAGNRRGLCFVPFSRTYLLAGQPTWDDPPSNLISKYRPGPSRRMRASDLLAICGDHAAAHLTPDTAAFRTPGTSNRACETAPDVIS